MVVRRAVPAVVITVLVAVALGSVGVTLAGCTATRHPSWSPTRRPLPHPGPR